MQESVLKVKEGRRDLQGSQSNDQRVVALDKKSTPRNMIPPCSQRAYKTKETLWGATLK